VQFAGWQRQLHPGSCGSTAFSEAFVRVGIDPTGGTIDFAGHHL
jgi:hypothetical protein